MTNLTGLDDLDIDITGKTPEEVIKINAIINNYIFTDNSVQIGDKNKIENNRRPHRRKAFMKYEDNSIYIGDKNKIKGSAIGQNIHIKNTASKNNEKWYSKLFWKLFIPIAVVVIAAIICLWLGLK